MGMVETGNDTGFVQVRLDIRGLRHALGARDFDRNRAVELLIKAEKNLAESALAQPPEDRVASELRGMEKREGFLGILIGGVCVLG